MKQLLLSLFILSILFVFLSPAAASPLPPVWAVNEQEGTCAQFYMGDECETCYHPEGWKVLKGATSCPDNYQRIKAEAHCLPRKTPFCCTAQHSGGPGDCGDVLVNQETTMCAFVEDINACKTFPAGWNKPRHIPDWGPLCPSPDYDWVQGVLDCGAAQ